MNRKYTTAPLTLFFVLTGCTEQQKKTGYTGKYVLDPVRDVQHIDGTVYDETKSIGTVREIVSEEDNFYLVIEFDQEAEVKDTATMTIEQSDDGRLYFRPK